MTYNETTVWYHPELDMMAEMDEVLNLYFLESYPERVTIFSIDPRVMRKMGWVKLGEL